MASSIDSWHVELIVFFVNITYSNRHVFTFYDTKGIKKLLVLDSTLKPSHLEFSVENGSLLDPKEKQATYQDYFNKLSNNPFKAGTEFILGILFLDNSYTVSITVGCRLVSRNVQFDSADTRVNSISVKGVEYVDSAVVNH